ncbi:MAG TPA: TonB-dependent receptor [Kofleriaceae bacterium]|nr:TonB-dependent receptor [Kofleriaceae bacterium]
MMDRHASVKRSFSVGILLAIAVVVGGSRAAHAQVNTAGLRGSVSGEDGGKMELAEVKLVHEPTQNTKTAYTNSSGEFAFTGLRVGGPYSVTITFSGFRPVGYTNIFLDAGKVERLSATLHVAEEEVIIINANDTPRTTSQKVEFNAADIDALPGITRDPKDVVQLTPEAYLEGESKALSIGGANNRFNSVTIDGIRQDDDFGLNASGYPTQRSPIAMNAIEQIAVERSPFDVRYGQFLGGNINIVTKSGTNEFHGALLGTFANQSLTGSTINQEELEETDFREVRYGLNLGGPIIEDKLHFFVSIEGLEATTPTSVGATGSGAANEIADVTVDDVDRIRQISRDVYGFDAGEASKSLDERDFKLMTKVDWQIDKAHHLTGKYQRTSGNVVQDTAAFGNNLPLTSDWYDQRDGLHAFSLRLNSDWTSNFATEAEFSGKIVDSRPTPLNGNGFMEATVTTPDGGTVVLGPDPFRHANRLDNDTLHGKVQGDYLLGTHLLVGGIELDRVSVYNLFVSSSNGEASYDSIEAFAAQMPSSIFYGNAVTNDPNDAAASFDLGVLSAYAQDQYAVTSDLTIQGGVRFEVYQGEDNIPLNPNFDDRYGFSNAETITGKSVVLPRGGASYRPVDGLNLRAGTGLYSGGTPNVWLSNNYTNNGVNLDSAFSDDPGVIGGFNGRDIPTALSDQLMAGDGNVDALDPDFKIPTEWKTSLGADYSTELPGIGDIALAFNYIYGNTMNGLKWVDLRRDLGSIDDNRPVGTLPDGRPYYDFDDSDGAAFNPTRGYDMLLTNTTQGRSHTASISAAKPLPYGFSVYGAYAYQNVTELSPATSSRSVSNYGLAAVDDPDFPTVARSNYERRHRIIGSLRYERPLVADIFGDRSLEYLNTHLAVFVEMRSGQPYSYTFGDSAGGFDLASLFGEDREFARRNRELFYVPRGDGSDVTLDGISEDELEDFLQKTGLSDYRGQIAPRNAFTSPWYKRVDLRLAQDVPGVMSKQKGRLMLDIQNLGNLLNSKWGTLDQVPFPSIVPTVDVRYDPSTSRYVYSNLRTERPEQVSLLASLWRVQLTLMYEF